MSGITGWFGLAQTDSTHLLAQMAQPLHRHDDSRVHSQVFQQSGLALACLSGEGEFAQQGAWLIAVLGRPRFDDPHLQARAESLGFAAVFVQAYTDYGSAVLEKLSGAFVLAALNESENEALLAVDRLGIASLCYTLTPRGLVFGSSLDSVRCHPHVQAQVDPQAIFDYVYFHMIPAPRTIYHNHVRLLPAEYLRLRQGRLETGLYWNLKFEEHTSTPFSVLRQEFLSTVREAVREAAQGTEKIGAFLSGGTDSSTLAGVLTEVSGAPAHTYSIGFAAAGYDEMEYARIAAKHFGTDHHEYYVTPQDIVDGIPRIASIYDQPFGNSSALPTYYCAKMARADGVTRLLGGDGGDELFGGNERYAKQTVFQRYQWLPLPLRRALLEPALNLPGAKKLGVLRKAASYVEQANLPMPGRLETYNLLLRFGASQIFTSDFLADVNQQHPMSELQSVYDGALANTLINRMLALDIKFTLADNDLPKVNKSCELAGVGVAYPMLANSVLAFSARLSPRMKLKGTRLRWFFKAALRDFLPQEILKKSKHGFGLPFGPWVASHAPLKAVVMESLQALKQRHIVRADFIDELCNVHLDQHAGYYGSMIWVLMMLEQWLQQHDAV